MAFRGARFIRDEGRVVGDFEVGIQRRVFCGVWGKFLF
jgi:hypothetical protein